MNTAIILAAGKGTRMHTDNPKCATLLLGKPLVKYLVDASKKSGIDKVVVVVGHKKEVLMNLLGDSVTYAYQKEQLGTGHAVKCAEEYLDDNGYTLIMPGDVPLIDEEVIKDFIKTHEDNHNTLTIGAFIPKSSFGYGRIVRKGNQVTSIVEEKDASEAERKITEVNSGLMCCDNKALKKALALIKNDNAKGEYYLTDIVKILTDDYKVGTFTITEEYKLQGINDLYQLSQVEKDLMASINKKHMLNGVRMENPATIQIGPDVIIEPNVVIRQNSIILGKQYIKAGTTIGPNAVIED